MTTFEGYLGSPSIFFFFQICQRFSGSTTQSLKTSGIVRTCPLGGQNWAAQYVQSQEPNTNEMHQARLKRESMRIILSRLVGCARGRCDAIYHIPEPVFGKN